MGKTKFIIRFSLLLLFLVIVFLFSYYLGIDGNHLSEESIREIAHENIFLLTVILFGVMFLQNLLNFFPIVLVISLNVSLLGLWTGYFFSLFCSVVASTIIFIVIRYLFIDMKAGPKYEKYTKKIEQNGFLFVLIARLIPIMPTNVINIASGLSSVRILHYFSATFIGHALYSFIIAAISFNIFY